MASLPGMFDANNVDPSAPRELLAPGKYPVQIVNSEMKDAKTGGGQYLALEMDVIEGPSQGRKLWENLNLVHSNPQTTEIANRTLSAICHATGQMQIQDSEQLHFKTMIATVAVEVDSRDKALPPNDPSRRLQNRIKGYEAPAAGQGAGYQPKPRTQNGGTAPVNGGGGGHQNGGGNTNSTMQQQPPPQARQGGQAMPWQRRA